MKPSVTYQSDEPARYNVRLRRSLRDKQQEDERPPLPKNRPPLPESRPPLPLEDERPPLPANRPPLPENRPPLPIDDTDNRPPLPLDETEIGPSLPRADIATRAKRVVGGTLSEKGGAPWHVSLMFRYKQVCAGAVISPHWIVTAAHCFGK